MPRSPSALRGEFRSEPQASAASRRRAQELGANSVASRRRAQELGANSVASAESRQVEDRDSATSPPRPTPQQRGEPPRRQPSDGAASWRVFRGGLSPREPQAMLAP